jgi:hypothetical protein
LVLFDQALKLNGAFNGIDGITGRNLVGTSAISDIPAALRAGLPHPSGRDLLETVVHRETADFLAPRYGIDPRKLSQTGWGFVCDKDEDPRVIAALQPLIDFREAEAGRLLKRCEGEKGHRAGMTVDDFFDVYDAAPGAVEPEILPYYLLIVGGPDRIPFTFQQELDVAYAVGRVAFDRVEDYARYAQNVIRAESGSPTRRSAALYGPRNNGDAATELSSRHLLSPLAEVLPADTPSWKWRSEIGDGATKKRLTSILTNDERPSFLMTAGHGIGLPSAHPRQRAEQGALVCQDWPGPGFAPSADALFRAADVPDVDLTGMMTFLFACFGAGTPARDAFAFRDLPADLAPAPFVAALPQALLARERGALAVVAHVDRAWGTSFYWHNRQSVEVFRSTIRQILDGFPIGYAMENFGFRYAQLATGLSRLLEDLAQHKTIDDDDLLGTWTAKSDAQFYALLGDPAARLVVSEAERV